MCIPFRRGARPDNARWREDELSVPRRPGGPQAFDGCGADLFLIIHDKLICG